ncbi:hypothetical protein GCM10009836_32020 [Pseudonocardia ailaonensis]|uniref:PDZ domain-containing protein n=1 Tax=Pseudonocardia ailaonensis TaxID=367279 RepID=A0ABN2N2U1_9PSEU
MTDEQRGQTRPEGDVAQHATEAGDSSTQQTENTSSVATDAAPAGGTVPGNGYDGATHPALNPYARPESAPYGYGRGSVYGTPGYAQHSAGTGAGQDSRPYGAPAYGPYAGASGAPGTGAPGAGGPNDPPPGGNTSVMYREQPPKRSRPMVGIVAAALIAGLVGGGAGFGGAYALLENNSSSGVTLSGQPATQNSSAVTNGTVAAAAAKATPSTVDIRVQTSQGTAEGSGVILTADGDVLTNNHVVAGSSGQIQVTLSDGSTHTAKVVGTSPSYDLAVIKLDNASGLTAAALGRTADVQVGQQVVAIGSPQGLTGTVTTGIVSALNRTVAVQGEDGSGVVYNGLQTDAPINQGNSGGPLVNLDGQVVGINSAIATAGQSTGSVGLGFAIPVDQARRVAQEIMNSGSATKPVLGVQGSTQSQAATNGATVAQVTAGGPAEAAGIKTGDVITKVGNATVSSFTDLVARIGSYAPGDKVTLTVGSGASARTVDVTLGSTKDTAATTTNGGSSSGGGSGSGGSGSGGSGSGGSSSPFGGLNPFGNSDPFSGGN